MFYGKDGLGRCETFEAENSIRVAATAMRDESFLSKISGVEFLAKEIKYHYSCKSKYLKLAERSRKPPQPGCGVSSEALTAIMSYFQENGVENACSELLQSI